MAFSQNHAQEAYQKSVHAGVAVGTVNVSPIGGSQARPASQDPASLREQLSALYAMCERINSQRNRLRDLADFILGPEPEEAGNGVCSPTPPMGGVVSDMVSAFTSAGALLRDVDRQIDRLQRVAS